LIAPIIFSCFECTNIIYVDLITLKSDQSRVRCHCWQEKVSGISFT
jgi:hypothetical protein